MMLSSTIKTLIGGTAPSSRPVGRLGAWTLGLREDLWVVFNGRGEETRAGGVAVRWGISCGREGEGKGGGTGIPLAWDF